MATFLRSIFFLLILANLLFLAWGQGFFGAAEDGREPQRVANQLAPEKLRITGMVPQPAAPPPPVEVCRLVSGLKLAEAQRLQAQAQSDGKSADLKFVVRPLETPSGFWVFIPPLANKAAADKKMAGLKQLGIADLYLMTDEGADKLAISLGMFSSEQAANEFLHALTKRGVKSVKMQPRSKPAEKAQLEARGPQDLLLTRLPELLVGSTGTSVGECSSDN